MIKSWNAWLENHWAATLGALTLLALVLRLVLLAGATSRYGGDEHQYVALARQWVQTGSYTIPESNWHPIQGGRPGEPTAFRTPVFPFFLAAHYYLFGPTDAAPRLSLVLLSALTCTLLGMLGRRLFSALAGLLAATAWAVWPPGILSYYGAASFYTENLATFLLIAAFYQVTLLRVRPSLRLAAAAGLVLALSVLTRPYLILLLPCLGIWLGLFTKTSLRWKATAVFAVSCSLVLGIWLARNWYALGSPVLATQSEHLYMGNNAWARGSMNGDVWTLGIAAPQFQEVEARNPGVWKTSELERSRIWSREGKRSLLLLAKNPKRLAWLLTRKTLLFWGPIQDWRCGFYRYHFALMPVLILAFYGLWKQRRDLDLSHVTLLALPILATFAVCLIAYSHDRFRYPAEPFMILLAMLALPQIPGISTVPASAASQ